MSVLHDAELQRLGEDERREKNWKRWGPYLAERQWGTVREDYSADGDVWRSFPHDHARSRVYRWGEDGLLGFTDRECRLCFAPALWNGRDPILKERLFGLSGHEGNHGEDAKECWFYLDATPTGSYLKALYKYPRASFPYERLVEENAARTKDEPEFELEDSGALAQGWFDLQVEYAKASPEDVLIRLTVTNRSAKADTLWVLPTAWLRNTWSWGRTGEGYWPRGELSADGPDSMRITHPTLGRYRLVAEALPARPELLFTENETNRQRLFGVPSHSPHVKDAFHDYVIEGLADAVNPQKTGTKAAFLYRVPLAAGESRTLRLRLTAEGEISERPFARFDEIFADRIAEADAFHARTSEPHLSDEARNVVRQARAGLLWSRQFYQYVVRDWLEGDPTEPAPPPERWRGRNADWQHLYNDEVLSMPDKWEYPWYAAWDLAFHACAFAPVDPAFAKGQLLLLLREWYMHPNGQIPAYEFNLSDANPPVHAWACWRVYKATGRSDRLFLARCFQKLLINFTWWVNRKDEQGNHLFSGGFLGLDNIGIFDRSRPLPTGGTLEQADGTGWMAFYCGTLLKMALELAKTDPAYTDLASKLFEHFVAIADAMNTLGGCGLWNEEDGFYYDQLVADGRSTPLKVRSLVGLVPLLAAVVLEEDTLALFPDFSRRMRWFLENRPQAVAHIAFLDAAGQGGKHHKLLAIPSRARLERVLRYVLDEQEFLSPFGIRSLSQHHARSPFVLQAGGAEYRVGYEPGESRTGLFGGNSNWRGPVWIPLNYLLIEALERYHRFYGDTLKVEFPQGSGLFVPLGEVARSLSARLGRLFLPDPAGERPCLGGRPVWAQDADDARLLLFHEYFHADTGRGLGASHQTGWTALAASLLEKAARGRTP